MISSNSWPNIMADFSLILRNGTVVREDTTERADIGIVDWRIAAIGVNLRGGSDEEVDATGCHIFPGVIDAHVHFNEPGRADWEGIETGSQALAAGGGTMFFDMPLNAHPPTIDRESFDLKLSAAQRRSVTDFAFWGGLVPGNVDKLEELAECGVVGFKAFMSDSGIDDFDRVDNRTLREGMKRAAKLSLPVAVHAESETLTKELSREKMSRGATSIRDYLESRPIAAELEAIRNAIQLTGETGCALHIVHVSSAAGIDLVSEAKANGVNVSCETCPHYFTLTDADVERIGALAKCAPPVRSASDQAELWRRCVAGAVDTIGSDHSPSPPNMKVNENFFKVWGGISGAQHTLSLLLSREHAETQARLPLPLVGRLLSRNVAHRFKLPAAKHGIEMGADADLAVVNLNQSFEVKSQELMYRHKQTPYAGRTLRGRVVRTILRGKMIFLDGKIVAKPAGRLVKPLR